MPTTNYDSSLLTQRRRAKAESGSFINRISPWNSSLTTTVQPTTGYAPLLGIYDQSIINLVRTGQMKEYRKNNGGYTTEDDGCPCIGLSNIPANSIIPPLFGWATRLSGVNTLSNILGITTDNLNNIYIYGTYFNSPLYIYNIDGSLYGTLANSGSSDAYIVQYNSSGVAQWATSISGTGSEIGYGIAVDSNNNICIIGWYDSPLLTINNFDSVSGSTIVISPAETLTNSGGIDNYIVKYTPNGKLLYV
jgi:hypothetical protein